MKRLNLIVIGGLSFAAGWLANAFGPVALSADPPPAKHATAPAFPMAARLGCNIWQQTSAEYRACCMTIYKSAELRLDAQLKTSRPPLPAVVMDLDETVMDNGAVQTFLHRNRKEYTDEIWDDYEANFPQDVLLVPGAMEFIQFAESQRVTVIFLSNRSDKFKKSTQDALGRLGVPAHNLANRLYLKTTSSEKATRREAIAAKYNVMMIFGDNLRDFSEAFAVKNEPAKFTEAIKQRNDQADQAFAHWGVDWFVLPNPVYGEWDKLLGPDPLAVLRPTTMKPKP